MKVKFGTILFSAVISLIALSTHAWSFPVSAGQEIRLAYSLNSGTYPGGPFAVYDSTGNKLFDTFCLERNEYISLGSPYKVSGIDEYASMGGVGGSSVENGERRDYISKATKWLYWQFAAGTLDQYIEEYSYDVSWGKALQESFWYLEEELTSVSGWALDLVTLANSNQYLSIGGTVKVMNLVDLNGGYAQSQLVATPAPVPEPGTLFLLGSGMVSLLVLRRRKK